MWGESTGRELRWHQRLLQKQYFFIKFLSSCSKKYKIIIYKKKFIGVNDLNKEQKTNLNSSNLTWALKILQQTDIKIFYN